MEVFCAGGHWWWVPIVGPLIGGVNGGWVYDLFITRLYPPVAAPAPAIVSFDGKQPGLAQPVSREAIL
mgnify:CR=1 FL=1